MYSIISNIVRHHRALFYLLILSLGLFLGPDPAVGFTIFTGLALVAYGFYTLPSEFEVPEKIG